MTPKQRIDGVLAADFVELGVLLVRDRLWVSHPERLGLVELLIRDNLDFLRLGLVEFLLDLGFVFVERRGGRGERRLGDGGKGGALEVDGEDRGEGGVFLAKKGKTNEGSRRENLRGKM
jgi:hypothetical protein